jgi:peptide chain release factor 3
LRKALDDLSEEGVIQVFYPEIGSQWIVGVVGQLQLEVLISRLEAEYKVEAVLEASPFATARWIKGSEAALSDLSPNSTAPTWPRTAMATWCSWPRARGT